MTKKKYVFAYQIVLEILHLFRADRIHVVLISELSTIIIIKNQKFRNRFSTWSNKSYKQYSAVKNDNHHFFYNTTHY